MNVGALWNSNKAAACISGASFWLSIALLIAYAVRDMHGYDEPWLLCIIALTEIISHIFGKRAAYLAQPPRKISSEQKNRISEIVRKFPEKQFDIAAMPHNEEAVSYAVQIEDVLREFGWKQLGWKGKNIQAQAEKPAIGRVPCEGVAIQIKANRAEWLFEAADGLANAIDPDNLDVKAYPGIRIAGTYINADQNEDAIHIFVGRKILRDLF